MLAGDRFKFSFNLCQHIMRSADLSRIHIHAYVGKIHILHITGTRHKLVEAKSVHSVPALVSSKIITYMSVRPLILALQASAPISSSHSPLSGNLTKAIACFRGADQCMKGVPRGLVPLTNWENMMLLKIWVASMLPSLQPMPASAQRKMTRRGSILISYIVVVLTWSVGLVPSM